MDQTVKHPAISVILPVYNSGEYVREAIDSILNQTFTDFELIILNDGSTDNSAAVIQSYNDSRIRIVDNGRNLGLIATLNKGIDLANGKYLARMDADDISLPERLSRQYDFLEKNSEVALCGTAYYSLNGSSKQLAQLPLSNEQLMIEMIFRSPIAHPTVMIRKEILKKFNLQYSSDFLAAEDYELWTRIAMTGQKMANLPEPLLLYRIHPMQTVKQKFDQKEKSWSKALRNYLDYLQIQLAEKELHALLFVSNGYNKPDTEILVHFEKALLHIRKRLIELKFNDEHLSVLAFYWSAACSRSSAKLSALRLFRQSEFYSSVAFSQRLKTVLKLLLR